MKASGERMVEGQRSANDGWRFIQFLRELVAALPGVTHLEDERGRPGSPDVGTDLIARYEGRPPVG